MKVFTCTNFKGVCPVGVAAVVVATDINQAVEILRAELELSHLPQRTPLVPADLEELDLSHSTAVILNNGDY